MKRSSGRGWDTTGDSAVGDVAGESLLVEVFSRIEDERDRVLILAHIGLDISLRNLARVIGTDRIKLADRLSAIMARLREDTELVAMLGDINRAGRSDRYQALVFRLGLQDWFCSYCGAFMLQSELGVKRRTCSDKCRYKLWKAGGTGWKDERQSLSPNSSKSSHDMVQSASARGAYPENLHRLLQPIEAGERHLALGLPSKTYWWQPETKCRDRALMLLGFTCPTPLSSQDLAELDVNDISKNPVGMEVRLYRRTHQNAHSYRRTPGTRYVIVPTGLDMRLCPVKAMSAWQTHLSRTGRTYGPLFIRMDSRGHLPARSWPFIPEEGLRLSGQRIAQVITNAARCAWPDASNIELNSSTPLLDYLNEILTRTN